MLAAANGNTIEDNDARGNGLLSLTPSLLFDLFDAPPFDNSWRNNQGVANFASTSGVAASSGIVAEAFTAGGCLSGVEISRLQ